MYGDLGTTRRITGDLSVRKQIRSIADDLSHGREDGRKRGGRVACEVEELDCHAVERNLLTNGHVCLIVGLGKECGKVGAIAGKKDTVSLPYKIP